jgi:hypothetical protein
MYGRHHCPPAFKDTRVETQTRKLERARQICVEAAGLTEAKALHGDVLNGLAWVKRFMTGVAVQDVEVHS